jgi:sugar phosphate isomerase/epimerase
LPGIIILISINLRYSYMEFGISTYTYTWIVGVPGSLPENPMTPYQLIDKTSENGLTLIQIADNLPLETRSQSELTNLHQYAVNKRISIEMGGRGLTPEHTMRCLQTAEKLGSPILRMVIDTKSFEPDIQTIISIIRDIEPELKSRNIRLAIENHDRLKAKEFELIINGAASEMVGICLDSVNSMGAGEGFETVSDILIPYTINLHIKDFTIFRVSHKMGLVIEGRPAGKGMLNIPDLVNRVSETGKCNSAILELWTPPEPTIGQTIEKEEKWAGESINYLKTLKWKN